MFTHGSSRVVIQSRHSTSFSLNEPKLVFQTKLDLSLCTVGTLSAFLQTADNICLLTCTVTCKTLLPHPARPPPVCPIPPSSSRLRSTNPVPSPQAASSQCKLKLHFILSRLDWPDSVFLLFIIGLALNVFYFPFYVIKFYVKKKKNSLQTLVQLRGRLVKLERLPWSIKML